METVKKPKGKSMNSTIKKILKITALTGIVTAGVFALINNEDAKQFMKESLKKLKKSSDNQEDDESDEAKTKLLLIAKQINRDIKNTECRTSDKSHCRNKKKYENINWDDDIVSRDDIIQN